MNAFNQNSQTETFAQRINAIVTTGFSVAVVATLAVMTTAQYLAGLSI